MLLEDPALRPGWIAYGVIENSVVYDSISRTQTQQSALHVSRYLGTSSPG